MRPTRTTTAVTSVLFIVAMLAVSVWAPPADAQDIDEVAAALEAQGWYIEDGAEGSPTRFASLAEYGEGRDDPWYFVSMAGPVGADFAETLRNSVRPQGNVLVYFFEDDEFVSVQFESGAGETIDDRALAPFDDDWTTPDEFMRDVVDEFERLTADSSSTQAPTTTTQTPTTTTTTSSGSNSSSDSGGSGAGWVWIAVPAAAVVGGVWFVRRRSRKNSEAEDLETAQKIREELQSELDELANDVIVLNGPVDLSENDTAITHYREAAATYTEISDEIPDLDKLADADLRELAELGARVAHARWQMDAAEAIISGDPIPEKPKVEPPPAPPKPPAATTPPPPRVPQRAPRPRVPYSRSRRSSGGGLLDILIAGSGMLGGGSRRRSGRSGGMFGGGSSRRSSRSTRSTSPSSSSRSSRSSRSSTSRRGGGVFGGGSSSRGSSRRSSSRSSSSRTRSRSSSSSNRRSASRTKRRR